MQTRIKQSSLLAATVAGLRLIPAGRVAPQTFTNLNSFTATVANPSHTLYSNSDGA